MNTKYEKEIEELKKRIISLENINQELQDINSELTERVEYLEVMGVDFPDQLESKLAESLLTKFYIANVSQKLWDSMTPQTHAEVRASYLGYVRDELIPLLQGE